MHGRGGNDVIHGLQDNDVICGGAGNDQLSGNQGKDQLFGEAGNVLKGGIGNDRLFGREGTTPWADKRVTTITATEALEPTRPQAANNLETCRSPEPGPKLG
jgi:hypothetical protein